MPKKKQVQTTLIDESRIVGQTVEMDKRASFRLGKTIGKGGFGSIHLASNTSTAGRQDQFVAKVETVESGGLFSEMACFTRCNLAEWQNTERQAWIREHKLRHLALPVMMHCRVAPLSGTQARIMIMPLYGDSIAACLEKQGHKNGNLRPGTALDIAHQLCTALEYLHSFGFSHGDIKSSNICLGKDNPARVVLIDFGCTERFSTTPDDESKHVPYRKDPAKADSGTIELTCVDAHDSILVSRRGDMEILGHQLIEWLGHLPWFDMCSSATPKTLPKILKEVAQQKRSFCPHSGEKGATASQAKAAATKLIAASCPGGLDPRIEKPVVSFLSNVFQLSYAQRPNYTKLRGYLAQGMKALGYTQFRSFDATVAGQEPEAAPTAATKRKVSETESEVSSHGAAQASKRLKRSKKDSSSCVELVYVADDENAGSSDENSPNEFNGRPSIQLGSVSQLTKPKHVQTRSGGRRAGTSLNANDLLKK